MPPNPAPVQISLEEALQQATIHAQAGRWPQARKLCGLILQAAPNHVETRSLLQRIQDAEKAQAPQQQKGAGAEHIGMILQRAVGLHQAGRLEEAIQLYGQVVQIDSGQVMAHNNMGSALQDLGRHEEAITCFERALALTPEDPDLHYNMGHVLAQLGRFQEAVICYRAATERSSDDPLPPNNLGNVLMLLEDDREALAAFDEALRRLPDYHQTHANRGLALMKLGRLEEAEQSMRRAMMPSRHPDIAPPSPQEIAKNLNNLGNLLLKQAHLQEAKRCFQTAIDQDPNSTEAHSNLGLMLHKEGKTQEALKSYQSALSISDHDPKLHNDLGCLLRAHDKLHQAADHFQRAVELNPDYADAHSNLGQLLLRMDQPILALKSARRAVALEPENVLFLNQLLTVLMDIGASGEALKILKRALTLDSDDLEVATALLFTNDMMPGVALGDHQNLRRHWFKRFLDTMVPERHHAHDRDPNRRLKIGYVSGDFKLHSAASTFGAALLYYDKAQFEVYCYDNIRNSHNKKHDEVTKRFQDAVDHWRDIASLSDDEAAALVMRDGIDILVDLSGHSSGNRLGLFARKPAPIQATGWGYIVGTALPSMDYLVIDEIILPPQEYSLFTEQAVNLPCGVHFQPLVDFPDVGLLPALENGHITFGAFHRTPKLNRETLILWAQTLMAVPGSKLLMKIPKHDVAPYVDSRSWPLAASVRTGCNCWGSVIRITIWSPLTGSISPWTPFPTPAASPPWRRCAWACR